MKKIKLKIEGMHCSSCAMDIDGQLEDNGVLESRTSYAKSITEVEFNPNDISEERIIKIIEKTGYKAVLR